MIRVLLIFHFIFNFNNIYIRFCIQDNGSYGQPPVEINLDDFESEYQQTSVHLIGLQKLIKNILLLIDKIFDNLRGFIEKKQEHVREFVLFTNIIYKDQ